MGIRSSRLGRVNDVLQREIAKIVTDEFKDKEYGMITISAVDANVDLSFAKVYLTVLQDDKKEYATQVLNDSAAYIRNYVAQNVKLRTVPKFKFVYDTSLVHGNYIHDLIESTSDNSKKDLELDLEIDIDIDDEA